MQSKEIVNCYSGEISHSEAWLKIPLILCPHCYSSWALGLHLYMEYFCVWKTSQECLKTFKRHVENEKKKTKKQNIKKNFDATVPVSKTLKRVLTFMHTFNSHWFLCFNKSKSLLYRDGLKYVSKHSGKTIYVFKWAAARIREVRNEKVCIRPPYPAHFLERTDTCCYSSDVFVQPAFRWLKRW